MIKEKVTRTNAEKLIAVRELKEDGFISSHRIKKMLNNGLTFKGDQSNLIQNMRLVAEHRKDIDCVKLLCQTYNGSIYFYRSWEIARILRDIEILENRKLVFSE